jgi:hypothetical protein
VLDRLTAGEIELGAAVPGQGEDFHSGIEVTGKGSLAVLFQE